MSDTDSVRRIITSIRFEPIVIAAVIYIVFSHLVGGFFIMIGLLTRYAAGFQLPILIAAVFLVHLRDGLTFLNSNLWIAIIVLILLIVFLIVGSGKYSYDERLKNNNAL